MESEIGKGSTFTFYLTFETHAYENTLPNVNATAFLSASNLNGMKVLVAEDNNINVLVIKRFLEKWGIHYRVANNGKIAVEMLERESFDLILMDIHMPEMDGEEATKLIRLNSDKRLSGIPIIALTANATVDMQQKLLNNGFTNYISKPFNPDNLFKLLKKHYVLM
jgi:CheY-like chemotaxis protein